MLGCLLYIIRCKNRKVKTRLSILLIALLLPLSVAFGAGKKFTLVIDAGHGGHDIGAPGSMVNEKSINLNVALAFGRYVEQACPDVRVVYTRRSDVFIPLYERADIANRAKADLFVSVHTNALPGGRVARGLQSYTLTLSKAGANLEVAKRENSVIELEGNDRQHMAKYDPSSPENQVMFELLQSQNMERSVEFAKYVQQETCAVAGRLDKGVHQANLAVLRLTSMPACLVELGFITTSDEEQFLASPEGAELMAKGIFNAFVRYKAKYNDKIVIPYAASGTPSARVQAETAVQKPVAKASEEPQPTRVVRKVKPAEAPAPKPKKPNKPAVEPAAKAKAAKDDDGKPVFKVQILAVNRTLRPGSQQLKGHKDVDHYMDGQTVKYTKGASTDYNEMLRLRKKLLDDFPQAFIIAFKDGQRMDITKAIQEFRLRGK